MSQHRINISKHQELQGKIQLKILPFSKRIKLIYIINVYSSKQTSQSQAIIIKQFSEEAMSYLKYVSSLYLESQNVKSDLKKTFSILMPVTAVTKPAFQLQAERELSGTDLVNKGRHGTE